MTRATRHRTTVTVTKVQFQWCWPSTVATPRKMKISVSLTLLHIFRKYLMVVCDLWEMLASTYGRITAPHAINLEAKGGASFQKSSATDNIAPFPPHDGQDKRRG